MELDKNQLSLLEMNSPFHLDQFHSVLVSLSSKLFLLLIYNLPKDISRGVIFTASINEFNDDLIISAYPNPTFSELNMELNNWANECVYALIDESGRIIYEGSLLPSSKNTLHLQELASGFYYLNINDQLSNKKAVVTIQKIN